MYLIVLLLISGLISPSLTYARVSLNEIYQEKRAAYEAQLTKLDPTNKTKVIEAEKLLKQVNLTICSRFDEDIAKLTAILEEVKVRTNREGESTTVAYGQGESQLDNAAYWLNFAQEAVAYQKSQDYTPQISGDASVLGALTSSMNKLSGDLKGLKGKILRAKTEMSKVVKPLE